MRGIPCDGDGDALAVTGRLGVYSCRSVLGIPIVARADDGVLLLLLLHAAARGVEGSCRAWELGRGMGGDRNRGRSLWRGGG